MSKHRIIIEVPVTIECAPENLSAVAQMAGDLLRVDCTGYVAGVGSCSITSDNEADKSWRTE